MRLSHVFVYTPDDIVCHVSVWLHHFLSPLSVSSVFSSLFARCIEAHLCEAEASGNATLCFNETMLSWEEESSPSSMLEQQTTKRHRELGSSETPSAGAGNSAHDGNGAGAGNGASADGESGAAQKGERDENDDINNDTSSGGDNDDEDDDQPPPPFLVRTSAGKEYLARKVCWPPTNKYVHNHFTTSLSNTPPSLT